MNSLQVKSRVFLGKTGVSRVKKIPTLSSLRNRRGSLGPTTGGLHDRGPDAAGPVSPVAPPLRRHVCGTLPTSSTVMENGYRIIGTFMDGDTIAIVEKLNLDSEVPEWLSHGLPEF